MRFDWDSTKASANKVKHGIDFDLAMTVFDDPFALIAPDPRHSEDEMREWIIGTSDGGILVVVFTRREKGGVFRIISARCANKKERSLYEKFRGIPI